MTTALWEVWSLTPDSVERVRTHHSNIVTICLTNCLLHDSELVCRTYNYNAANLVNVKVHLSWHLQLHSKIATSSSDARRKINLTCEVPKDKRERTEDCM